MLAHIFRSQIVIICRSQTEEGLNPVMERPDKDLTRLNATYACPSEKHSEIFNSAISNVSPWHLCIVMAQANFSGSCVLNAASLLLYTPQKLNRSTIDIKLPIFLGKIITVSEFLNLTRGKQGCSIFSKNQLSFTFTWQ